MKRLVLTIIMLASLCPAFAVENAAAGSANEDQETLSRLASATGMSISLINSLAAKPEDILKAYCIGVVTGNNPEDIIRKYKGDFKTYYKDYSVSKSIQDRVTSKYNSLLTKVVKKAQAKSSYSGIDQEQVAKRIEERTSISAGTIKYYGFKSGVDAKDILQAAEMAQKTGNSFSGIIEVLSGGSWSEVWAKYSVHPDIQSAITSKTGSDSPYVLEPAVHEAPKKTKPAGVSPEMEKIASVLSEKLGVSRGKVMDYLKEGESQQDVVQAFVISTKTGNDVYNIFKLRDEGGWGKVYKYYNINGGLRDQISGLCGTINNTIKPPAD